MNEEPEDDVPFWLSPRPFREPVYSGLPDGYRPDDTEPE